MSTVVKDLGAVSAYAYAVEKGYTGTEAEFAELMADYAEVGQRAEDAANSALESKTAAQTAATTATNKASEAATSAQTATTKAGEATTAAGTATTAKNDAVAAKTAAETAQGKAEDAQAAAERVAESIPSDYSQLSEDVSDLKEGLNAIEDVPTILNLQKEIGRPFFTGDRSERYDYSVSQATLVVMASEVLRGVIADVTDKGTITITKDVTSRFLITTFSEMPVVGSTGLRFVDAGRVGNYTLTLDSNEKYLLIDIYHNTNDASLDWETVKNSVAIVSSTAEVTYSARLDEMESDIAEIKEIVPEASESAESVKSINAILDVGESVDIPFFTGDMSGDYQMAVNASTLAVVSSSTLYGVVANVKGKGTITVTKNASSRFMLATFANVPIVGATALRYFDQSGQTSYELTIADGENYLLVLYYRTTGDSALDRETIKNSVSIKSSTVPTKYSERLDGIEENVDVALSVIYAPLTALPSYVLNSLAYKPLGTLTEGYILMSFDDGLAELATYTIPTLIAKGVKGTFGLFSTCACLTNDTYLATVLDAVNNHDCCVAQHGAYSFGRYTEKGLADFFEAEATAMSAKGISNIYGAICPGETGYEDTSTLIQAVAGGRFGAVFSGGLHGEIAYGEYSASGSRTNMYAMPRQSGIRLTEASYKTAIDYAFDNHLVFAPFWHDVAFTNDASRKAIFEGMIDYALSKGLTFITMEDLPNII